MRKKAVFTILGMNRDLALSKFDGRFAYENKNLRLITDEANGKFVMTNERGPKEIELIKRTGQHSQFGATIDGNVLGTAVIQNYLVIFTHEDPTTDRIYRFEFDHGQAVIRELYSGNLGFEKQHPIESITFYENEKVQKVYWTDGINQPRVINVADLTSTYNDDSFDFAQKITGQENIVVERMDNVNGSFASGAIQYCFTYYNNYGQETNIVRISSLNYIAQEDRGTMNENVGCAFKITITGLDRRFDGIRVYSIQRTSADTTPIVKRVADIQVTSNTIFQNIIDNGTMGNDVDPMALLYIGSKNVRVETMAQKDNTLFLGNIKEVNSMISEELKSRLGSAFIEKSFRVDGNYGHKIGLPNFDGYYPYKNQLDKNSREIKYFKYGETYRFGVQFQDKYGRWSDVVRLTDGENDDFVQNIRPINDFELAIVGDPNIWTSGTAGELKMTFAEFVGKLNLANLGTLVEDYVAIRPVAVYPDQLNRTIVAQGILCPTIYNLQDRVKNRVAGQVSWFARPIGKHTNEAPATRRNLTGATQFDTLEYRHMCPIPPTNEFFNTDVVEGQDRHVFSSRAELSCNFDGRYIPSNIHIDEGYIPYSEVKRGTDYTAWANLYPPKDNTKAGNEAIRSDNLSSEFFVDQSILTFHSPELEFDRKSQVLPYDDVKMRIVGVVPITSTSQGVTINLVNADAKDTLYTSRYMYKNHTTDSPKSKWQMSEFGGIKGDFNLKGTEGDQEIVLKRWIGNMRIFPLHGKALTYQDTKEKNDNPDIWYNDYAHGYAKTVADTQIATKCYDTMQYSFANLYCPNYGLSYDILTPNIYLTENNGLLRLSSDAEFANNPLNGFNFDMSVDRAVVGKTHKVVGGYAEYIEGYVPMGLCRSISGSNMNTDGQSRQTVSNIHAVDAVLMKYKTTSCAVVQMKSVEEYGVRDMQILPSLGEYNVFESEVKQYPFFDDIDWNGGRPDRFIFGDSHLLWDKNTIKAISGVKQSGLLLNAGLSTSMYSNNIGYYYLAELYRPNVVNRFGGDSEEAVAANIWVPCGEAVSLIGNNGGIVEVRWTEGDTYYQRYDNLHTYPYTFDDVNQIVDIVSFICETRINIDGRYDTNRGKIDNEAMSPVNFNKLNDVYSQSDNIFQYRSIDPNRIVVDTWPNTITWGETKIPGEINDTWTKVSLASTLELDGVKGPVRSLRSFANSIFAFQDTGISRILYNENFAVTADNGVPLEIANSGKVTGRMYLTQTIGCQNKWSIATSPSGMYFMDDIHGDILVMSGDGQLSSVGIRNGFKSWVKANSDTRGRWFPGSLTNVRSLYDTNNSEVMFVTDEEALSYSEVFSGFTSFYDYGNVPFLDSVAGHNLMMHNDAVNTKVYEHNKGSYNNFFGENKPFWTELVCNSDGSREDSPLIDKTWMNVGFIFDSFDGDKYMADDRFNKVDVENEYQRGETSWDSRFYPTISKKFRHWSADLPRDNDNPQDRIRSQWVKMRLTKNEDLDKGYKSIVHSIDINYNE